MTWSLNEVEVTAKKAVRGAGYSWGLAEEAGKAVRWLCANGFDGCDALADLLDTVDRRDLRQLSPRDQGGAWKADDEMCPLAAGVCLSDRADAVAQGAVIRFDQVAQPVLMLPFLAMSARATGSTFSMACDSAEACTEGSRVILKGDWPTRTANLEVSCRALAGSEMAACSRANPAHEVWANLNAFASRTYAPDTAESRLKGAGAGLNDND